ncbi:MAG: M35 family metallo-endopeptidase [Gaiellaceae bacterium]
MSESARIFSSWAVAVAKLVENLPALDFALLGAHTPLLKRKLLKHFKATTAAERKRVLRKVVPRYHMILAKMGPGLAKVRCGGTDCEHRDYAYTNSGSQNSTLWLCSQTFIQKPILDLAATWIHELSHSLYDTDDNGYYTYSGSTKLDLDGSLNEADCYGNFMVDYT